MYVNTNQLHIQIAWDCWTIVILIGFSKADTLQYRSLLGQRIFELGSLQDTSICVGFGFGFADPYLILSVAEKIYCV